MPEPDSTSTRGSLNTPPDYDVSSPALSDLLDPPLAHMDDFQQLIEDASDPYRFLDEMDTGDLASGEIPSGHPLDDHNYGIPSLENFDISEDTINRLLQDVGASTSAEARRDTGAPVTSEPPSDDARHQPDLSSTNTRQMSGVVGSEHEASTESALLSSSSRRHPVEAEYESNREVIIEMEVLAADKERSFPAHASGGERNKRGGDGNGMIHSQSGAIRAVVTRGSGRVHPYSKPPPCSRQEQGQTEPTVVTLSDEDDSEKTFEKVGDLHSEPGDEDEMEPRGARRSKFLSERSPEECLAGTGGKVRRSKSALKKRRQRWRKKIQGTSSPGSFCARCPSCSSEIMLALKE